MYIAAKREDVSAVISFSPGDYLAETKGSLADVLEDFNKPMFLTSSNSEAKRVTDLLAKHKLLEKQVQFVPEGAGHHGSRALWKNQQGGRRVLGGHNRFLKSTEIKQAGRVVFVQKQVLSIK